MEHLEPVALPRRRLNLQAQVTPRHVALGPLRLGFGFACAPPLRHAFWTLSPPAGYSHDFPITPDDDQGQLVSLHPAAQVLGQRYEPHPPKV